MTHHRTPKKEPQVQAATPASRMDFRRYGSILLVLAVTFLLFKGFMAPLHLADADIGRHIKNGELAVTQGVVPTTNYYSYTAADYPVINHHWGSGVVFYLLYRAGGFTLLSWSYVAVLFSTAMILFLMSIRASGVFAASVAFVALWPLISFRLEIRPEGFSALLCAIFTVILWLVAVRRRALRLLLALPVLTALWVNLHIYFIMGLFIIGVYGAVAGAEWFMLHFFGGNPIILQRFAPFLHSRDKADAQRTLFALAGTFAACCLAALINPHGIAGALEPFFIFREYGYLLVENQSIWFLRRVLPLPQLDLYEAMAVLFACIAFLALIRSVRRKAKVDAAMLLIATTFCVMAALALRNFSLMGLYTAPALAACLGILTPDASRSRKTTAGRLLREWGPLAACLVALAAVVTHHADNWARRWQSGIVQLLPGGPGAIEFFQREHLHGPIFNNYDIGGLLILGLFPQERVFVDNRPEAYPASFFTDLYIPMQQEDSRWREAQSRFGFNVIFFGYRDLTPWGQTFLNKRLDDPAWAPVYADMSALIFVPNDEAHRELIEKYRLPRNMFGRSSAPVKT